MRQSMTNELNGLALISDWSISSKTKLCQFSSAQLN